MSLRVKVQLADWFLQGILSSTVSKLGRHKSQLLLDLFRSLKIELKMFPAFLSLTIFCPLDFFPQSAEVMKKILFLFSVPFSFFDPFFDSPAILKKIRKKLCQLFIGINYIFVYFLFIFNQLIGRPYKVIVPLVVLLCATLQHCIPVK